MSKGSWSVKPTELVRFVKAVKATGLPVRNVEYSAETKLVRVNIGTPDENSPTAGATHSEWD
jgi:hypothetical protein